MDHVVHSYFLNFHIIWTTWVIVKIFILFHNSDIARSTAAKCGTQNALLKFYKNMFYGGSKDEITYYWSRRSWYISSNDY